MPPKLQGLKTCWNPLIRGLKGWKSNNKTSVAGPFGSLQENVIAVIVTAITLEIAPTRRETGKGDCRGSTSSLERFKDPKFAR